MRGQIAVIAAIALLSVTGCPNKRGPKGQTGGDGGEAVSARRCDALRDRVRDLYADADKPATDDGKRELAADILAANVEMVMTDCAEQPSRLVPCIEQAGSSADIERDCLIPLDDEGTVEGKKFGGK